MNSDKRFLKFKISNGDITYSLEFEKMMIRMIIIGGLLAYVPVLAINNDKHKFKRTVAKRVSPPGAVAGPGILLNPTLPGMKPLERGRVQEGVAVGMDYPVRLRMLYRDSTFAVDETPLRVMFGSWEPTTVDWYDSRYASYKFVPEYVYPNPRGSKPEYRLPNASSSINSMINQNWIGRYPAVLHRADGGRVDGQCMVRYNEVRAGFNIEKNEYTPVGYVGGVGLDVYEAGDPPRLKIQLRFPKHDWAPIQNMKVDVEGRNREVEAPLVVKWTLPKAVRADYMFTPLISFDGETSWIDLSDQGKNYRYEVTADGVYTYTHNYPYSFYFRPETINIALPRLRLLFSKKLELCVVEIDVLTGTQKTTIYN